MIEAMAWRRTTGDVPTLCHWPSWHLPFDLELERLPEEPCPYFSDRKMRVRGFGCDYITGSAHEKLFDAGVRRSGRVYYQPACDDCRACVPIRVPTERFRPSRSQRRCLRKNADLAIAFGPPTPTEEKLDLYARYLSFRHPDGQMTGDADSFEDFLYKPATESIEVVYRTPEGRLLGVGLCDLTPTSLSTVYFYSEPGEEKRGLGTFSVLTEIDFALRTDRLHYYLGYWIADSPKMAYKNRFRPAEGLGHDGVWRELRTPMCPG